MFLCDEIKKVDLNYFFINRILQDENLMEIQSRNTGDYWIIKKDSLIGEKFPIVLYHKHLKQKYYHRHWQCYTVNQCINSIYAHDDYYISRHKVVKKSL